MCSSDLRDKQNEETEKGPEKIFEEIIVENFPNMGKEMDIQTHETQRTSNQLNPNRATLRSVIIKISKVKYKERILQVARDAHLVIQGPFPIRLLADFFLA